MNDNTRYRIVTAMNEQDLSSKVSQLVAEGWKCQGGMVCYKELHTIFAQALVLETPPEAPSGKPKATAKKTSSDTAKESR